MRSTDHSEFDRRSGDSWHLDKKVPISIILALLVHASATIWFISKIDSRVGHLEVQVTSQHERDEKQDATLNKAADTLNARLDRIDAKLDRLIELRVK